jgi:hypothetical protein
MKIFKYKFTKLTTAFIYLGIVVCALGFGLNVYLIIKNGTSNAADPVYPILQYSLMFFITIVLASLFVSFLVSSYYSVDDKFIKTSFGFIKSKYEIERIEVITLDRKTNKLSVTFSDNTFMILAVKEEWYNDFTETILKAKPNIEYTIISKDPDTKK